MDFSWDSMAEKLQDNAYGDKKTYDNEVDTRFWKLSRDEKGDGGAIIRFLPDPQGLPFQKITKIRANLGKTGGYFVNEWSPTSIGLKCPFNEKFSELWNAGEKEKAKTLKKADRFMTNIKVINDPANPANNGKIFLYEMSKAMIDMLKEVMIQTDQMKALDESPVAVFNPLVGQNFIVKIKDGDNDIPTYAASKFSDKITGIYETSQEAEADIIENCHSLSEWIDPKTFKSYDELLDLRDRFLKEGKYSKDTKQAEESGQKADNVEKEAIKQAETKIDTGLDLLETPSSPEMDELDELLDTPAVVTTEDSELDDLLSDLEN